MLASNDSGTNDARTKGIRGKDPRAAQVLRFWFGEENTGEARREWFMKNADFDAQIREHYLPLYETAVIGGLDAWLDAPGDCLALVIVLDQFPRNMFRGSSQAFAADLRALAAARHAVDAAFDHGMAPVERMFLYLPFEHSEDLDDQWRSIALMAPLAAWPQTAGVYPYAVRHWEIIRRFGRFPHRNAALGRVSTPEEVEFLNQPGSGF